MDDESCLECYWEQEFIADIDFVFRRVSYAHLTKDKPRRIPNESHFSLRPDEDGLSVNWDEYIDIKGNFILTGLIQNFEGKYRDYKTFRLFMFKVGDVRHIDGIIDVVHKPCFNGNPAPVGKPNNRSHSIIVYPNDVEIRMSLSDYCRNNYDESYCPFEAESLDEEIKTLISRLNDTPWHKH